MNTVFDQAAAFALVGGEVCIRQNDGTTTFARALAYDAPTSTLTVRSRAAFDEYQSGFLSEGRGRSADVPGTAAGLLGQSDQRGRIPLKSWDAFESALPTGTSTIDVSTVVAISPVSRNPFPGGGF